MQYILLIYANEAEMAKVPPEAMQESMGEWFAYTKAMRDAGHYVAGDALEPTLKAASVRVKDGERIVTDGPFAETTEQLGGYYLMDVPDHATALDWAAKCPGAKHGTIEIRPVMVFDAPDS